jgi:hypothetical protein
MSSHIVSALEQLHEWRLDVRAHRVCILPFANDPAIVVLFAQHLESSYRVADDPDPLGDFASPEGREILRRDMLVLKVDTLFGPVAFDENQRNIGREAAGSQWLPNSLVEEFEDDQDELQEQIHFVRTTGSTTRNKIFSNRLVAPFLQAEAAAVVVADSAKNCDPGQFVNETEWFEQGSILRCGCSQCPVDTFVPRSTLAFQCTRCPAGSTTDGLEGQESCYDIDDNLLSPGALAFGYLAVALTWILGFVFMCWIGYHRNDPVVRMSQKEFLLLICVGAMISSSTIIALSFQAGSDESTKAATAGCTAAPFLYAIGWALQYASLSAKTYRLYLIMRNSEHLKRVKITFFKMLRIVFAVLAIDLAILISWTVVSPLIYARTEPITNVGSSSNVVTVESVGSCVMEDDAISFWAFAGPIMGFHFILLIGTNYLLFTVRNVADRYQEQKYIAMASILMFEILIVGIPVLVAVNDSPVATHIILVGIIAVSDIGILCFTFVPKIFFQQKGLEEGVSVEESIMRDSHRRLSSRETSQRRNTRGLFSIRPKESEMSSSEFDSHVAQECANDQKNSLVPFDNILVKESIVEEKHSDLEEEMTSEDLEESGMDRSSSSDHAEEGGAVEPFGLLNEHERMMQMTATLMREHERMMQTTANIMNVHEKRMACQGVRVRGEQESKPRSFWPSQAQDLRAIRQIPREIATKSSEVKLQSNDDELSLSSLPRQSDHTDITEDISKGESKESTRL